MLEAVRKLLRPVAPRPPEAPTPDLEAQRTEAQEALGHAQDAVERARERYDATGSEADEQALLDALTAAQVADERLGRAERLLEAGRDRDAENERRKIEAQIARIDADLDELQAEQGRLAREEASALHTVVEARHKRLEAKLKCVPLRTDRKACRKQLGHDDVEHFSVSQAVEQHRSERTLSQDPVLDAVQALLDDYPPNDPRRDWLRRIAGFRPEVD